MGESYFKVSGNFILANGFSSMNYEKDKEYDIRDIGENVNDYSEQNPTFIENLNNFKSKDIDNDGIPEDIILNKITGIQAPWICNLPLPYIENYNNQIILKGTYPRFDREIFSINGDTSSNSVYRIYRTDEDLKIYLESDAVQGLDPTLTLNKDQFPNNIVPYVFLFEMQGAGSGGAGSTYGKWKYSLGGAGGAGGGYAVGALCFANADWYFKIKVGHGSKGGIAASPVGYDSLANSQNADPSMIEAFVKKPSGDELISYIICDGGSGANIPVIPSDKPRTDTIAQGYGGNVTFMKCEDNNKDTAKSPIYVKVQINGADGGGPLNWYDGQGITSGKVICAEGLNKQNIEYGNIIGNFINYTGGEGGNGIRSIEKCPFDGGRWKGSGGGGASASGNGGLNGYSSRNDKNLINGGLGAGGSGGYWEAAFSMVLMPLSGGNGGNGFIKIYY